MNNFKRPYPVFKVPTAINKNTVVKKPAINFDDTNTLKEKFQNELDDSIFNIDENVLLNSQGPTSVASNNHNITFDIDPPKRSRPPTPLKVSPMSSQRRLSPSQGMSQWPPPPKRQKLEETPPPMVINMDEVDSSQEESFKQLYSPDRDPELSPLQKKRSVGFASNIVFTQPAISGDYKVIQTTKRFNSLTALPSRSILKTPPSVPGLRVSPTPVFKTPSLKLVSNKPQTPSHKPENATFAQRNLFPSNDSDSFTLNAESADPVPLDATINLDLTIDPEMQAELMETDTPKVYVFQNEDDPYQSSQKFLTDVQKADPCSQNLGLKSKRAGVKYMERQRTMAVVNDENVTDDMIHVKVTNTQLDHLSQHRRDVEAVFEQCDRSIQLLEEEKRDIFDEVIDQINWDELSPMEEPPLHTQVNLLRQPEKPPESPPHVPRLAPVSSSPFCGMGPFFGLPIKVKKLIKEYKGVDELYDWQKECLRLPAVANRQNLIYALPTSGGKTLVAEILMLREIICRRKNVIFILPYVAIVQEKIWAMSPFAVGLEFLVEEYASGKGKCPPRKRRKKNSIFIATIEKSLALIDSLIEEQRLGEIGLVVVDELHLLGEDGRGATLESVLTKLMYMQPSIQIVGMSATIGNLAEIGEFLSAKIYTRDFRPVELKEYLKCGNDLLEINSNAHTAEEAYKFSRTLDYEYSTKEKQMDPDCLAGLVQEVIPENSCLIFCSTKRNCEDVATLICKMFRDPKDLLECRKSERDALVEAIIRDTGTIMENMRQCIPYGVAYHHSGLTSDERRLLEDAFRLGILCVITCTSTLAAGVNLPCKRVIIRQPYIGRSFMTQSKYKQMIGRAGRAGMGEIGESILICPPRDNLSVNNLILSAMDDANSSMHARQNLGFRNMMLSAIGLGIATTRNELLRLSSKTLLATQAQKLEIDVKRLTDDVIKTLYKMNALAAKGDTVHQQQILKAEEISVHIHGTQSMEESLNGETDSKRKIAIRPNTPLEISKLGRAAFKACLDLHKAQMLYEDLCKAQKSLVLTDYLHLLYLCTPYESVEERPMDWRHYYYLLSRFDATQYNTSVIIGVDENCLNRMHTGKAPLGEKKRIIYRFCVTLMLYDLWNNVPIHEVAEKYDMPRGYVQNLMSQSATQASVNLRFCEELDEFWAFKQLFGVLIERLSYCCSAELVPLMQLPAVKIGRAKQLYNAGFKNLDAVAASTPNQLMEKVEHLNLRVAKQLISAAKVLLLEKVDSLREQAQEYLEILGRNN